MIHFIKNKTCVVAIENGELISFKNNTIEFIHQKGSKGWRKSDDEMFPIIGPTDKNNFKVHTPKGDAIIDQHGLLRELAYTFSGANDTTASFIKNYTKNSFVKNSKFPEKSTEQNLFWPYDFSFEKKFTLDANSLRIDFIINSDKDMPFMLGYHPAFLLSDSGNETIQTKEAEITLNEIKKEGDNAYPVLNTNTLVLKNSNKSNLEITTTGFHNFMLWTQVNNMLCIEPITHYTSHTDQNFSEKDMLISKGKNSFSVVIKVL